MTATPSVAWRELFDRAATRDVSVGDVCDELAARRDE